MLSKIKNAFTISKDDENVVNNYTKEYVKRTGIMFSLIVLILMTFIATSIALTSSFIASTGSWFITLIAILSLFLSVKNKPRVGSSILIIIMVVVALMPAYFAIASQNLQRMLTGNLVMLIALIIPAGIIINKYLSIIIAALGLIHVSIVSVLSGGGVDFFLKSFPILAEGFLIAGVFIYYSTYLQEKMQAIIQEYNEQLEDKVKERTEELNVANDELKAKNDQMMKDLEMAERVQLSIIPKDTDFPHLKELAFGSNYKSMESIGGDIYDVIRVGRNGYGFLMADVSGHGVPAALITTMAKVSFNAKSKWGKTTAEICTDVNQEMFQFIGDLDFYLTAYYAILDLESGELQYTNCGHHPAILFRADSDKIENLDTKGFFIGAFDGGEYGYGEVTMQEGDRLLMFTDGIIEARNSAREFYGYERLMDYVKRSEGRSTKQFVEGLREDIEAFCGEEPPDDDRAILFIEFVSRVESDKSIEEALHIEAQDFTDHGEEQKKFEYIELYKQAMDHISKKDYEKAIELLMPLKDTGFYTPKVLNAIGISYYKMGRLEEAYKLLKSAIEHDTENQTFKKNLSIVKKKLDSED